MTFDANLCCICSMTDDYNKHDWEVAAKSLLKTELARHNMGYRDLSVKMEEMGIPYSSPDNLKSKVNRGSFSAAFLIQVLIAIGSEQLDIKNLPIRKTLK
mgnify:CR=1 FL=1